MRSYKQNHSHYYDIDWHARTMYLCLFDALSQIVRHQNMKCRAEQLRTSIAPYRHDLVIDVECIFSW